MPSVVRAVRTATAFCEVMGFASLYPSYSPVPFVNQQPLDAGAAAAEGSRPYNFNNQKRKQESDGTRALYH